MISIPRFTLLLKQQDPPHRKRVIVSCTLKNGVEVELASNWPRNAWFLYATKEGFRMSQSVRTTSKRIAETWERAVRAGEIEIR